LAKSGPLPLWQGNKVLIYLIYTVIEKFRIQTCDLVAAVETDELIGTVVAHYSA